MPDFVIFFYFFFGSEHATYNCPWEKHVISRLIPHTSNDWPCDLFMVIANASLTGNWCNWSQYPETLDLSLLVSNAGTGKNQLQLLQSVLRQCQEAVERIFRPKRLGANAHAYLLWAWFFGTWRQRRDDFKQVFSSSAGVERGITGNVCLKSPANSINAPSIGWLLFLRKSFSVNLSADDFFCAIVHSSQIMSLHGRIADDNARWRFRYVQI